MTEAHPFTRVRLGVSGAGTRVRLDLGYDGTAFSGWAAQPGRRTVQGVLQDALATVLRVPAALTVAGRTDAGVHASGQVVHLDVPDPVWAEHAPRLLRRLAGVLPADVRVRTAVAVPGEFDARFSALERRYDYRLDDTGSGPDPLRRGFVVGLRGAVDDSAMAEAAAALLGLHDFAAFCKRPDSGTTIRTLTRLDVERRGGELVCAVAADAFCHSMVRSLVGALLTVGEGRRAVDWPASLLTRSARSDEVPVAPARGLSLVGVSYPPDAELATRNARTRTTRVGLGRPGGQ